LLRLRVGQALLVGLLLYRRCLLLRSRLLPCILLLLMVGDGARRPYNYRSGSRDTRGTNQWSSSS
jgi:hypothetical protein